MKSEHCSCISGEHFVSKLRYALSAKYTLNFEDLTLKKKKCKIPY